jgi:hypothetical protein
MRPAASRPMDAMRGAYRRSAPVGSANEAGTATARYVEETVLILPGPVRVVFARLEECCSGDDAAEPRTRTRARRRQLSSSLSQYR